MGKTMSKKATIQANTCYQCCHAYLMRSVPHNPIVSECSITKQREVASTHIRCRNFKQRTREAEIHTMIPCCI